MPAAASGMKVTGLLFSRDNRDALLHEPLADRPSLLIHYFAKHLARKRVFINRLHVFKQRLLTQQSIAQELFQGAQTLLLIELGYLDETFEGQPMFQSRTDHQ